MKFIPALVGLIVAEGVTALNLQSNLESAVQSILNPSETQSRKPNILFVITDDQDLQLDSISYTPRISKHIRDQGTFFRNHFVTTALCCPSRVSLWTGRQAHNTNVTDVHPPYGGYPKFVDRGLNDDFLPLWLQGAGYDTYYTGKMFTASCTYPLATPGPRINKGTRISSSNPQVFPGGSLCWPIWNPLSEV